MTTLQEYSQYDIAMNIINYSLSEEEVDMLLYPEKHGDALDKIWFESAFKRFIRNDYNLWTDSILTRNWRDNPESRFIKDDIDYSEDHPDQVSDSIFKLIVQLLNERLDNGK